VHEQNDILSLVTIRVRYSESLLFPLTLYKPNPKADPNSNSNLNPNANPNLNPNVSTEAHICTMDFRNSGPSE